jgi:hypothetical protein
MHKTCPRTSVLRYKSLIIASDQLHQVLTLVPLNPRHNHLVVHPLALARLADSASEVPPLLLVLALLHRLQRALLLHLVVAVQICLVVLPVSELPLPVSDPRLSLPDLAAPHRQLLDLAVLHHLEHRLHRELPLPVSDPRRSLPDLAAPHRRHLVDSLSAAAPLNLLRAARSALARPRLNQPRARRSVSAVDLKLIIARPLFLKTTKNCNSIIFLRCRSTRICRPMRSG